MATFMTDPRITYMGLREPESPLDIFSRFFQLQALADERKYRNLRGREESLRVAELERQARENEAMRQATTAGVSVEPRLPLYKGAPAEGAPETDVTYNPSATLARLQQLAPHLVPGMQQELAKQQTAAQERQIKTASDLANLTKEELANTKTRAQIVGMAAMSVLQAPPELRAQIYAAGKEHLEKTGIVPPGTLPPQYTPDLDPLIHSQATQAADYWKMVNAEETKRHNLETEKRKPVPGVDIPLPPEVQKQKVDIARASKTAADVGDVGTTPTDSESSSILAQTGLSLRAFMALTGRTQQLPRDAATRNAAMKEAQNFANKRGVDVSTLASQYQSYNDVLSKNIGRMNQTRIMEDELLGTIQNLQGVVNEKDLGKVNFANVAKIWAGQQVNDNLAQQYAMHLYQLRNELAAYGAATQGRSGNEISLDDRREAETTIRNGIATGSLAGLQTAVQNSTDKMGKVLQRSVDSARKGVWNLFGVGQHFKPMAGAGGGQAKTPPAGATMKVPGSDGKMHWSDGQRDLGVVE